MTTICDLTDTKYPKVHKGNNITPMPGRSLVPAMKGDTLTIHEALYWEHLGNRAIRKGEWKLVARKGDPWELYNLSSDRSETNNLILSEAQIADELEQIYEKWAEKVGVDELK
jgi:arylsulfatase